MGKFTQTKLKGINFEGQNISFIGNPKQQNALDISFSDNATLISGYKNTTNFEIPSKYNLTNYKPPAELKKLYEE